MSDRFGTTTSPKSFSVSIDMLDLEAPDGAISLCPCLSSNVVCLGRDSEIGDYFFFYSCLITDVHVRFSLDEFSIGILRSLNVA